MHYNKYSNALMKRFGEKVYKIPINLPITCPNRDGSIGKGGCAFCGEIGAGFEAQESCHSVSKQLADNIAVIAPKYHARKFIAYFQNYTNTYMALDRFKAFTEEAASYPDVIGISISTRPDCISEPYLAHLKQLSTAYGLAIEIELGLQTVNEASLLKLNRGHGVSEFLTAVKLVQAFGFTICTHLIGNIPWDTEEDLYEAARLINHLKIDAVKLHSLYILKESLLGQWYTNGEFSMIDADTYIQRVIHFLRILNPEITIQRLFGRAPESMTLFCNWGMSWRKLQNELDHRMTMLGVKQGDLYEE